MENHEMEQQALQMLVTSVYGNNAILRQIVESVRINRVARGCFINSKKEWNYVKLPRAIIEERES